MGSSGRVGSRQTALHSRHSPLAVFSPGKTCPSQYLGIYSRINIKPCQHLDSDDVFWTGGSTAVVELLVGILVQR